MNTARSVTFIPATMKHFSSGGLNPAREKRVAAYARVSTDSEEQLSSYEAQVEYYTQYIQAKDGWVLVDIYADEGISGTSTKNRTGFKTMVADALAGRIDLIITKSVSRFARNTVDTLITIRTLKEKNVEVFFEKENLYTLDSKGELLLTIFSSLAESESLNISENTKWGQRKRFADGQFSMPYKQFLGYEKGEDGQPKIVEAEADTVRLIYRLFLEGKSPSAIATILTQRALPTPSGKDKWCMSTVHSILTNEKYSGCAILQKCFTVDFRTKKKKVNEGEIPQFFVQNSHSAIISPELFEIVQYEMRRRKERGKHQSAVRSFSSKVICGECGNFFGVKLWHSNDEY